MHFAHDDENKKQKFKHEDEINMVLVSEAEVLKEK